MENRRSLLSEFLKNIYTFFELHDVSDRTQQFKQQNYNCAPYFDINDTRLKWLAETFSNYIKGIQKSSKLQKLKGLSLETAHAQVLV